jgi:hypothetical protein
MHCEVTFFEFCGVYSVIVCRREKDLDQIQDEMKNPPDQPLVLC